jgi:hypothetical protein
MVVEARVVGEQLNLCRVVMWLQLYNVTATCDLNSRLGGEILTMVLNPEVPSKPHSGDVGPW